MAIVEQIPDGASMWKVSKKLERQLRDYVNVSLKLIWQRQAIFFAATVLTAFYFDPSKSLACYACVLFTEVLDLILARRVRKWDGNDLAKAKTFLAWIIVNTILSAGTISLFVIMIALQEDASGHFTPLFFLFAAALFAAMNNHQLLPALILRLMIYGSTFFFIALLDIWVVDPPLGSKLWLNFFTVVFVMYFIIDCSFQFLQFYKKGAQQLDEIRKEHKRTKEAYEVKSKFLATVSHELRTPLTSIKGSLDLVNSGSLGQIPQSMASMLRIAGKNSARLAYLINDLLDLQKIESGEMDFQFGPVDVNELVVESVDATMGFADSLGIKIETQLPDEIPFILADYSRLMQVMANLLSNALKFSHENGVVTVCVEAISDRVRISVADQGVGIPENSEDKVFGQFSQIDSSDQRKVGGTGLGMSITKKIVERHDGTIGYTSSFGLGTSFFVEFDKCEVS